MKDDACRTDRRFVKIKLKLEIKTPSWSLRMADENDRNDDKIRRRNSVWNCGCFPSGIVLLARDTQEAPTHRTCLPKLNNVSSVLGRRAVARNLLVGSRPFSFAYTEIFIHRSFTRK